MEQYTESQYDDDLTVGVDEYDDFVHTEDVDLFEFYGEEESTISRLKTIVLSIDWEITDENLGEFNTELLRLKSELPDDKINLVYIQALEKIGKYIAKEKSNSNHNAVKLLQTFFYTLEKNLTTDLSSIEEKKALLKEDVQKFEKLKGQISGATVSATVEKETTVSKPEESEVAVAIAEEESPVEDVVEPIAPELSFSEDESVLSHGDSPLLKLKAIVLGMDWEITDKELVALGKEVKHLEGVFKDSRPKVIFLQGIGALGAYIKTKRSNAHADVFKLLHSFCENLEKIVDGSYSYDEEKAILLPEVEKFNEFKKIIASTIDEDEVPEPNEDYEEKYGDVAPAFADVDDDVAGFQEEEVASSFAADNNVDAVDNKLDSFFGDSAESSDEKESSVIQTQDQKIEDDSPVASTDEAVALQGVDVETEADDDSDEEPLPFTDSGELAPALLDDDADADEQSEVGASWKESKEANEIFEKLEGFFNEAEEETVKEEGVQVALQGVDVETDADDESDEEPLPFTDSGEIAPALSDEDDVEESTSESSKVDDGLESSMDNIFGEDEPSPALADEEDDQDVDSGTEELLDNLFSDDETEDESDDENLVANELDNLFGEDPDESTTDSSEDETTPALATEEDGKDTDPDENLVANELDNLFGEDPDESITDSIDDEVVPALATEEEREETETDEELVADEFDNLFGDEAEDSSTDSSDIDISSSIAVEEDDDEELIADEFDNLFGDDSEISTQENEEDEIAPALFDDEKIEDQTEKDLEEDVDSFFMDEDSDDSEEVSEPETDEIIFEDIEESDPSLSVDDDVEASVQEDDEEVVFQLVDDDNDTSPVEFISETFDDNSLVEDDSLSDEKDAFSAVFEEVVDDEKVTEEVSEEISFQDEEESETLEAEPETEESDEDEDLEEYFKNTGLGDSTDEDTLRNLRISVSSIGVELDDVIVQSLLSDVREVSQKWSNNPVGKIMLQLMSTIIQHIDQYRYEASSDAHGMLLSVFDKVEVLDRGDIDSVELQELLLAETSKVLLWQQKMLDRQAVRKGDTLTFMDPVRSDETNVKTGEFVFTEEDIVADDQTDQEEFALFGASGEEVDVKLDDDTDSLEAEGAVGSGEETEGEHRDDTQIATVIREELHSLKKSLQDEIESLRSMINKE